ncbi:hypothetical protein AB832_07705 [Flavobacteriaceae bacterium (ex Bugula neritina AB1)]|nr:hypothetical protein AB832_07705 [Flavobacteriaceae bacterium (ex Bugula neritina AB1)]
MKIIKTKENKFDVKRNDLWEIVSISCAKEDLKTCLRYIENYGFMPAYVKLKINSNNFVLTRNGYSGRISVNGVALGGENYPQSYNDVRVFNAITKQLK